MHFLKFSSDHTTTNNNMLYRKPFQNIQQRTTTTTMHDKKSTQNKQLTRLEQYLESFLVQDEGAPLAYDIAD